MNRKQFLWLRVWSKGRVIREIFRGPEQPEPEPPARAGRRAA